MEIVEKILGSESKRRRVEVALLLLLILAYTLPFIGQAVHHDAQLDLDWAKQELEHPLWQHIPDYDYFGRHYDQFFDTHPRLHSLYLTLFLRLDGGAVSEPLLHLAVIPFPLMAALAMYWLARRFKVNAFIATLLLLISPIFLVNTHLIMYDIPGIALWLAGLACFIKGVDRSRLAFLLLGAMFFTMSIFVFYQGMAVIPLSFLYLVLQRKVGVKPVMALAIPVVLFLAFMAAHFAYYSKFPSFSYFEPIGLPMALNWVLLRIRGVQGVLGAAALLPGLGILLFPRSRASIYATGGVFAVSLLWISLLYMQGTAPVEQILLIPLFLSSGFAITWYFVTTFLRNFLPGLQAKSGQDLLFLSTWFLGTLFYCSILMPYASPRFMMPILPPLAIVTAIKIHERWGADRNRFILSVTFIAIATFVLSMSIAVAENQRANYNIAEAEWVRDNLGDPDQPGKVWYSGYLGFQTYLQPYGYHMLMVDENEPAKGDLIVETLFNGRWIFKPELSQRLQLVQTVDFERNWPVITYNTNSRTSWMGYLDLMQPYGFAGDFVERMYVYRVSCDPGMVLEEGQSNCIPYEEEPEDKDAIENRNKP